MKVYIASKYENKVAVREAMELFRAAGHTITHDWTSVNEGSTDLSHRPIGDKFMRRAAEDDWIGLSDAEVFVLLVAPNMKGAWVELGIALELEIEIIVVGGKLDCIFERLADQNVATVQEALGFLP